MEKTIPALKEVVDYEIGINVIDEVDSEAILKQVQHDSSLQVKFWRSGFEFSTRYNRFFICSTIEDCDFALLTLKS